MYRVRITEPAKQDVRQNLFWWSENRDHQQAERWYEGIYAKIDLLATTADRYSFATEAVLREAGIKQVSFSIGRRPTHRIIFGIQGEEVVTYRVRSFKQEAIGIEDLSR